MRRDEELVKLALDGDKKAFDELVDRYDKVVFSYVVSQIKDVHGAEDVVQESFLRAYTQLGQCRDPSRFAG
jgi:RNA polymerase sigma-70 factor (ECF subfamily)